MTRPDQKAIAALALSAGAALAACGGQATGRGASAMDAAVPEQEACADVSDAAQASVTDATSTVTANASLDSGDDGPVCRLDCPAIEPSAGDSCLAGTCEYRDEVGCPRLYECLTGAFAPEPYPWRIFADGGWSCPTVSAFWTCTPAPASSCQCEMVPQPGVVPDVATDAGACATCPTTTPVVGAPCSVEQRPCAYGDECGGPVLRCGPCGWMLVPGSAVPC